MSYRIDPERALVLTQAWGVLTDSDILAHKEALLSDPAFGPHLSELSDVRRIERLDVTPAGVRAMVAHDATQSDRLGGHRLALLVDADAVFGMARMYQILGDRERDHVGVFRTEADATAWLATDRATRA